MIMYSSYTAPFTLPYSPREGGGGQEGLRTCRKAGLWGRLPGAAPGGGWRQWSKGLCFGEDWEKADSTVSMSSPGSSSIYPDEHRVFALLLLILGLLFSVCHLMSLSDTGLLVGFIVPLNRRAL